jgi:hypothetical protein
VLALAQRWLKLANGRYGADIANQDTLDAAVNFHNDSRLHG